MIELTCRITTQGMSNTAKVDDDRFDAITFPFNLGLKTFHLITVEGISNIATDIDGSHDCGLLGLIVWTKFAWWLMILKQERREKTA